MIENSTNNMEKSKKPIYKRVWFIILVIIIVLIGFSKFKDLTKGDKISQSALQLGNQIVELPKKKGKIVENDKENLDIELYNIDEKVFNDYLNESKEKFNKDSSSTSGSLYAYNNENYEISLTYYKSSKEMHLKIKAPMEANDISWGSSDIANLLPVPKVLKGKINTDTSNEFMVYIMNTSKSDYDEYVNECSNAGFNIDYKKYEKSYDAQNSDGYKLSVSYLGGDRMSIDVKKNVKTEVKEDKKSEEPKNETSSETKQNSTENQTTGISKEFKDAMDSYEQYIDEYIAFMKNYSDNKSDLSLIKQYATMLQKYQKASNDFDKWNDKDLNKEEQKYYVDVQTRVNKKLANAAIDMQ